MLETQENEGQEATKRPRQGELRPSDRTWASEKGRAGTHQLADLVSKGRGDGAVAEGAVGGPTKTGAEQQ